MCVTKWFLNFLDETSFPQTEHITKVLLVSDLEVDAVTFGESRSLPVSV